MKTVSPESLKARWQELQKPVLVGYRNHEVNATDVVAELCRRVDQFLLELIAQRLGTLPAAVQAELRQNVAIVAVGGYGRGEMFPHSDVDLLITYAGGEPAGLLELSGDFVRDCWDAGFRLGQAVRSIKSTIHLCREESQVATALVQTRLLWGNREIYDALGQRFENWLQKSRRQFIDRVALSRKLEVEEAASAVFSLEPDVKCSPGGLRDLQVIQWVGKARYHVTRFSDLVLKNALRPDVALALEAAQRFLTEIRLDLHLAASRVQDVLTRQEQLRLTHQTGITDYSGQRAVERFMQRYFNHASLVALTSERFIEVNRPSTLQERVAARVYRRVIAERFIIVGGRLNVLNIHVDAVTADLTQILKIFLLAAEQGVRPAARLLEVIKQKMPRLDSTVTSDAAQLFLRLLAQRGALAPLIRDLFECGLLEVLIPEFAHARGLLQFNLYHAFTVDEHTLRTVEVVDKLQRDSGPAGQLMRTLERPALLTLSLLVHDLGKGYEEDHSIVGEGIARRVGERLQLPPQDTAEVALLVRQHLSMSVLAFRRDTSDPDVVADFGQLVQSAATLRKLYLLTICDIRAVAPGIWNDWKARLLHELYERTERWFSGQYDRTQLHEQIDQIRQDAIRLIEQKRTDDADAFAQIKAAAAELERMPEHYLLAGTAETIAAELDIAVHLPEGEVRVVTRPVKANRIWELTLLAREQRVRRCFYRLAGVLTAMNLSILSAEIHTGEAGLICDRFLVTDRDAHLELTAERVEKIKPQLAAAALRPVAFEQLFQQHRRYHAGKSKDPISDQQSSVLIDNDTSSQATIIEVFAHDRAGLLFTLAKAIYDLELSITQARITTHVDQVVDVFYVTDLQREKVTDPARVRTLQERLTQTLTEFERYGYRLYQS